MPAQDLEALFERTHVFPQSGRTLIVGSRLYKYRKDRRTLYKDAIGVDMIGGPGVDRVLDLEAFLPSDLGMFSHIECFSVLEHSRQPWILAANLERLLHIGSTFHVEVPFIWRVHSYPSDYWRFTAEAVRLLFPNIKWHKIVYAHERLIDEGKVPMVLVEEHKYFARTEVYGFGERV